MQLPFHIFVAVHRYNTCNGTVMCSTALKKHSSRCSGSGMALKMVMMGVPTRLYVCDEEEFAHFGSDHNTACYNICTVVRRRNQRVTAISRREKNVRPGLRQYLDNFVKNIYITLRLIQFMYK
jgi:hypothetical protein